MEVAQLTIKDVSINNNYNPKNPPTVVFNVECECGCPICLGDHDRFCRKCGKRLPLYNEYVDSNAISVDSLFKDSLIIELIKTYLNEFEVMEEDET